MASRSLAILVIDENRIRASIIEAGLRETGHDKITVVHDITGIARTIAEVNPDVIVIDLENAGIEACAREHRALRRGEVWLCCSARTTTHDHGRLLGACKVRGRVAP
jgi:AmiR/NasT family two-component response regulator